MPLLANGAISPNSKGGRIGTPRDSLLYTLHTSKTENQLADCRIFDASAVQTVYIHLLLALITSCDMSHDDFQPPLNNSLRNVIEEFSTKQQNFILLNSPRSVVDSSFSTASSKAACANLSRSLSSRWWLVTTSVSLHLEGLSAEAGEDSREGRGRREQPNTLNQSIIIILVQCT